MDNVSLTAEYFDEFGRRTTVITLYANDERLVQQSYLITQVIDQRLVKGIDYEKKTK